MKSKTFALTALAASLLLAGSAIGADKAKSKGPNEGDAKGNSAAAEAVQLIATANELALYGIRNADAVAIIEAAKIKKGFQARALEIKKKGDAGAAAEAKTTGYDLSADSLLERAASMAGDSPVLAGLIADARATKSRGAAQGPAVHADTVKAGNTDNYTVTFKGGEQAAVLVSGDGDTDLDLYVVDEAGNDICSDTDGTDTMVCSWTPRWTGDFTIRIKNYGKVYNNYQMAVN